MTKYKLSDYLMNKRREVISKLKEQFEAERIAYFDARNAKINTQAVAEEINKHIDAIIILHDKWEHDATASNKDLHPIEGKYGTVPHTLYNLTYREDAVLDGMMSYFEDVSAEYTALKKRQQDLETDVYTNYRNVEANMKKCRTAKDAIQYLVNLGFSASEIAALEPETCTDVMAPVDTKKLF